MMQSTRPHDMSRPWLQEGVEGTETARGHGRTRVVGALGAVCALCGVVAWSYYGSASEPARASPLAFYVPQMVVPKAPQLAVPKGPQQVVPSMPQESQVPMTQSMPEVPRASVPEMAAPSQSQVPQVPEVLQEAEVPITMLTQPIAAEPATPLSFLVGLVGGFAAGAALVYSLLKKAGQKVSVEAKKLELGALTSVAVESPSVAPAGVPIEGAALAPYLAGGSTLPAVLKQVTSGRAAIPALGSQLRSIDIGQGRRVVVNMIATDLPDDAAPAAAPAKGFKTDSPDDAELAKKFCYGLPGSTSPFRDFDPWGFLEGKDKLEVYALREAELTHGRVGMLASLGFLVQENYHPLFDGVGGPAIKQMPQLPVWLWVVMLGGVVASEQQRIVVGWAELDFSGPSFDTDSAKYRRLRKGYYPGDLGFDPLNLAPKNPEKFREMQNRELNNGRLAMLAAAGFMAQEAVTKQTWGAYFAN